MKILQLIDTLNPGGAERMALNYYHALKDRSHTSILVVTREEGLLAEDVKNDTEFHFLEKKSSFDPAALRKLKHIIKSNYIEIVHAHGTSWFMAVLCKMTGSSFKLIWHDHYGDSEFLSKRPLQPLKMFSRYFDGIISVNKLLEKWAREQLKFKKALIYLPNFIRQDRDAIPEQLKGRAEIKIICVANLRPQKDHLNLLKAFEQLQKKYSVSLHLFGRDYRDAYSENLKKEFSNRKEIYYYGEVASVRGYLKGADIGVLASKSEGLPLALIEYGLVGLPVVCTKVGECPEVTGGFARLSPGGDAEHLARSIAYYIENPEERKEEAQSLKKRIKELYSEVGITDRYLQFTKEL